MEKKTKLRVNEIFGPTIQGEGIWSGQPAVFMRLVGCNLRCVFKNGSICDTPYSSHNPEAPIIDTVDEALERVTQIFKDNPNVSHLIITGGEPMLQQHGVAEFINRFNRRFIGSMVTMETNGTTVQMEDFILDLASFSPKLKTSGCFEGSNVPKAMQEQHHRERKNFDAIYFMNAHFKQLKFVYSDEESGVDIDEWISEFKEYLKDKDEFFEDYEVLIMPEGSTEEQLKISSQKAVEYCISRGYRFCDRVHIRIWGSKRAV